MSRAGYSDDWEGEGPPPEFWSRAVANAMNGKRGRKFMTDLREALDAMPVKELIHGELRTHDGDVCAMGAVGVHRGVDMASLERPADCSEDDWESDWECEYFENSDTLAKWFNIAPALVREVMYQNDEGNYDTENSAQRWTRMRKWVARKLGESWNG